MATAGWYPDPSGAPGAFRYYDGTAWTEHTTAGPPASPSGPPTQPPPQPVPPASPTAQFPVHGQGGGGWLQSSGPPPPGAFGPPPGSPPGGTSPVVPIIAAVVAVIVVATGAFFGVRALVGGGSDSSDQADTPPPTSASSGPTTAPTSDPTTPPTSDPTDGGTVQPTSLECTGGQPTGGAKGFMDGALAGGGLSVTAPSGFDESLNAAQAFTFATKVFAPSREIETAEQGAGWIATYALGGLNRANGFGDPQQAAGAVLTCMTESKQFYRGFTGRTDLDSHAVTVSGRPGWEVDAEIRVQQKGLKVPGDVAKVIVVDLGDPASYGLFVSVVPIGDQSLIDQQTQTASALTVS